MFDEFFLDVLNRRDCTYEYFDEKEAVYKFAKFDSGKMIADFMILLFYLPGILIF